MTLNIYHVFPVWGNPFTKHAAELEDPRGKADECADVQPEQWQAPDDWTVSEAEDGSRQLYDAAGRHVSLVYDGPAGGCGMLAAVTADGIKHLHRIA